MKDWNEITPLKVLIVLALITILLTLLPGCYGTYYITDAEYSDLREEHESITYYDNQIYWGWYSGYYYYYGKPHYYPWTYYYNSCPPSHYTHTTHVVITRPVNKPTHRPNRNITVKPNRNIKTNTTIKVNTNRNYTRPNSNTKVKTNRTNIKVKTNTNRSNKNRSTKNNSRKPR
tara:strand:- start:77 stop:598 length:522 start_codon:yes stop_codon:yes gene_type:complete